MLNELDKLKTIQQKIFDLSNQSSVQTLIDLFDYNYSFSFNFIISHIVHSSFVSNPYDSSAYINFLMKIEEFEETNKIDSKIYDAFSNFLLEKQTKESLYLLSKMFEQNLIDSKILKNYDYMNFINYKPKEEQIKLLQRFLIVPYECDYYFINNHEELSKNDWELHKQLIKEGVNPNEISKIIRNDEIGKLQEISTQEDFDFNQIVQPSLYERCSFINNYVYFIDYAAFFSAVKCFKYLLINGADVENTGKYAVAGGNLEIIHLCEQNNSTFKESYKAAIKFHRNDIFYYLYENKIEEINNLEKLGKKCIIYDNYEIFIFLLKEGMKVNEEIIGKAAKIGNLFFIKHFLQENNIPNDILICASHSGNVELVMYLLKHIKVDINAKDIYLFYLILILRI